MTEDNHSAEDEDFGVRAYNWMTDLAADLTELVADKLREGMTNGFNPFDLRYAIMHAHLIGIAGAIYASDDPADRDEMLKHFEQHGGEAVLIALQQSQMWKDASGFEGEMETHSDD